MRSRALVAARGPGRGRARAAAARRRRAGRDEHRGGRRYRVRPRDEHLPGQHRVAGGHGNRSLLRAARDKGHVQQARVCPDRRRDRNVHDLGRHLRIDRLDRRDRDRARLVAGRLEDRVCHRRDDPRDEPGRLVGPGRSTSSGSDANPSWSPDGSKIVYASSGSLITVTYPGGVTTSLPTGRRQRPAGVVTGRRFDRLPVVRGGHNHIYVVPYASGAGGTGTQITPSSTTTRPRRVGRRTALRRLRRQRVRDQQRRPRVPAGCGRRRRTDSDTADLTPDWQTAPPARSRRRASAGRAADRPAALDDERLLERCRRPVRFTYQWFRCDSSGNNCPRSVGDLLDVRGRLSRYRPHASNRRDRLEHRGLDRVGPVEPRPAS